MGYAFTEREMGAYLMPLENIHSLRKKKKTVKENKEQIILGIKLCCALREGGQPQRVFPSPPGITHLHGFRHSPSEKSNGW